MHARSMIRSLSMTAIAVFATLTLLNSCASGGGGTVVGNESGSAPINQEESNAYKKAIVRCYKIGGTRVVKIEGTLRCY